MTEASEATRSTVKSPPPAARVAKAAGAALVLAALCVAVRAPWAGGVGFKSDMRLFQGWASTAAELRTSGQGIGKIYQRRKTCNYPPLYLIILSYLPAVDTWLHGEEGWEIPRVSARGKRSTSPHFRTRNHLDSLALALKLPAMVADLAITLVVLAWVWVRGSPERAVVAASLWALNPISVYNSAYFGQVDAIHSLWMLAALLAAIDRRIALAWGLVALALLTKAQAIVIVPVVAMLSLQPLLTAARRVDGVAIRRQLRTLLLALATVIAVAWLVLAPFARDNTLPDVQRVYAGSVSERRLARVTIVAYNLWWLTLDVPVRFSAIRSDKYPLVGPLTPRQIGFGLLGALAAVACLIALWGGGRCSAMLTAPIVALAFFMVSTQMKSRYGFSSLVLMLPLITCGYRYGLIVVLTSVMFLVNCARVLSLPAGFFGLTQAINGVSRLPWTGHVVAAINLCVLVFLLFELLRCAQRERRARRAEAVVQIGA